MIADKSFGEGVWENFIIFVGAEDDYAQKLLLNVGISILPRDEIQSFEGEFSPLIMGGESGSKAGNNGLTKRMI
ncbi:MAG: hypothetical protein J1E97_00585 [Muribaculaceae bacterium]|nr:hypothetical protein [Muribaculaceae bacterium]